MIQIKKEEYARLIDAQAQLNALEAGGVDNWDGYEFALEDYWKQQEEEELKDNLLDELCEHLCEGAYEVSERGAGFTFSDEAYENARMVFNKYTIKKNGED